MTKKTILLITDDQKTALSVKESLGHHVHLEAVASRADAKAYLAKKRPDLLIIDFDIKETDGLQIFRELGTSVKVIMLSASASIPLVVTATKQGVEEFLRKPIDQHQLLETVGRHLAREPLQLRWLSQEDWLSGGSPALRQMYEEIQEALRLDRHIILVGAKGIALQQVAEFIHINSPRHQRRLATVAAAAFNHESLEGALWATLQKLLSLPDPGSLQDEADRCGTIFLSGVEQLDGHVRLSLFSYFGQRRGQGDKTIRAIIGLEHPPVFAQGQGGEYAVITVPPLSQRKEDLPYLIELSLKRYSQKYGKKVDFIAAELLDFLVTYDYPGNYEEMQKLIEEAVLAARGDKLELEAFPFSFPALQSVARTKALRKNASLADARRALERDFYYILLKKANGDTGKVARFLDLPKASLAERLQDLLD